MAQITMDLKDYEKLKKEANKKEYYKSMYEYEQEELKDIKEYTFGIERMLKLILFMKGDQLINDDVLFLFNHQDKFETTQIIMEGSVLKQGTYIRLENKGEE